MAVIRWSPFRDMDGLQHDINRIFNDWTKRSDVRDREMTTYDWAPRVDIYEDTNEIHVTAELPGIEDKDVKVSVEENMLTISGEKKLEKEKKKENYHRVESYYGNFSRSFALPPNVDREKISAKMDKGKLNVLLPKKEEAKPKQINVKIGK